FSTQELHCRDVSTTASDQLGKRRGGHSTPLGGDKTNRYTCERARMTLVRANKSAGHSRNRSVIGLPVREYQTEAGVGSSSLELGVSVCCSWSAILGTPCQDASTAMRRDVSNSDAMTSGSAADLKNCVRLSTVLRRARR